MGSKDKAIERKYGVLGFCKKDGESRIILNTLDNIIRCYSCPFFRPKEKTESEEENLGV